MEHQNDNATADPVAETPAGQIWDAILRLYVDWVNAARTGDEIGATHAEHELRFFALTYASLLPDGAAVTTGRKAILRTIYVKVGGVETAHVRAMLNLVIAREEAAARRNPESPGGA